MSTSKEKEKNNTWDVIAESYTEWIKEDKLGKSLFAILEKEMLNSIGDIKNKTVLDLGCGDGYLSRKFAKLKSTVFAIDGSSEMINLAIKNSKNENITFQVGDIREKLPYNDECFDYVVSNMVLMYCEEISLIIQEISRILKTNGKFLFSIVHPCFKGDWGLTQENLPVLTFTNNYNKQYSYIKKLDKLFSQPCVYYNRPIHYYVQALIKNQFSMTNFIETSISNDYLKSKSTDYPLWYNVSSNHLIIGSVKV